MLTDNLLRASTSESYSEKKVFFRIGNTTLYSIMVIRQFYFSNKYVIQYLRCEILWSKVFLNIWYVSIERFVSSFCLWYILLWCWSSCIDFLNFFGRGVTTNTFSQIRELLFKLTRWFAIYGIPGGVLLT